MGEGREGSCGGFSGSRLKGLSKTTYHGDQQQADRSMRAHAGSRLKGRPVRRASFYKRPSNAIFVFLLLFVVVVYAFTFLRPAAVHSRNSLAAAQQQQRGSQKGAFLSSSERLECGLGVTTSLGFD